MGATATLKTDSRSYSLWSLSWPIFIELFLATLLGTVDTLMVSRVSDDAVAVVGLSNQLFNGLNTLFMTITGGAGILVAQKLGSRKPEEARTIGIIAAKFTAGIGLCISAALCLLPDQVARLIQMPEELLPLAAAISPWPAAASRRSPCPRRSAPSFATPATRGARC
ncbi:MATE family efflux transporter [Paenibacillus artemisiicola]|uniref:MATE family efflux transporter n=1 Tax=Paenibacillus artemisiicola TaxID=1172618 RepID=UPI0030B89B95